LIQWFLDRKINKSLKPIHRNGFTGYFAVRVSFAIFTPIGGDWWAVDDRGGEGVDFAEAL
jgi:hypothetical protein